jgi:penicillin-insensitive murein DD-endopeptidase
LKGWSWCGCSALPLILGTAFGCTRTPTPLDPAFAGSIGLPYRGCLTDAVEIPSRGPGYRFLRDNDRHFATARFASVLERAAAKVNEERPGGMLVMGDLSTRHGGQLTPHFSHRSGHDADLLLYAMTVDGTPVEAPDFVHYGSDGLAWDEAHGRFVRFDVEREWLLVRALILDPEARVEWMFSNHVIEALLTEWAIARGESNDVVMRAELLLFEPHPGGPHDDHIHIRTACSVEEEVAGCETGGPERPWLASPAGWAAPEADDELVSFLVESAKGLPPLGDRRSSDSSASRERP